MRSRTAAHRTSNVPEQRARACRGHRAVGRPERGDVASGRAWPSLLAHPAGASAAHGPRTPGAGARGRAAAPPQASRAQAVRGACTQARGAVRQCPGCPRCCHAKKQDQLRARQMHVARCGAAAHVLAQSGIVWARWVTPSTARRHRAAALRQATVSQAKSSPLSSSRAQRRRAAIPARRTKLLQQHDETDAGRAARQRDRIDVEYKHDAPTAPDLASADHPGPGGQHEDKNRPRKRADEPTARNFTVFCSQEQGLPGDPGRCKSKPSAYGAGAHAEWGRQEAPGGRAHLQNVAGRMPRRATAARASTSALLAGLRVPRPDCSADAALLAHTRARLILCTASSGHGDSSGK